MADTLTLNVPQNFDMNMLVAKLRDSYQMQGFAVSAASVSPNNVRITFSKDCGGINMLLGLGQGITANCSLNGNMLYVNYSDGDWTGKIIGLAVGWIICWIPFVTSIIGCINQFGLPKKINTEITMIVSGMQ